MPGDMKYRDAVPGPAPRTSKAWAHEFWKCGYRVFGINGERVGDDDPHYLKRPLAPSWRHTPIWSPEQMDIMDRLGNFDAAFGIVVRGLVIVDVDYRRGGVESLGRLVEACPALGVAGLTVATGSGSGSRHLYFRAPQGVALLARLEGYPGIEFRSSGYVVGPGSAHASGGRYEVIEGGPDDVYELPQAALDMLRDPGKFRAECEGEMLDLEPREVAVMLTHVKANASYDQWLRIGMALHNVSAGNGLSLWREWSKAGGVNPPGGDADFESHWHAFGKSADQVTIATLMHHAREGGWTGEAPAPVAEEFAGAKPLEAWGAQDEIILEDGPFDLSSVDLLSPPGLVGQIAEWIETGRNRRSRKTLAVASALSTVANVAGLKYTDDKDGVTTNLFVFCIAGSGTGKEAVQQAQMEMQRAAGVGEAAHGTIKSEQEVIRNLIHHQAALYSIDEFGFLLTKIKNAQKKGGSASHLEAVLGILMSAYSKASGHLLLGGDVRRELQKEIARDVAALTKKVEENEATNFDAMKLERCKAALDSVGDGLDRPFLALIGYTTPNNFDDLMDYEAATSGFIGRALIFTERDTVPPSRKRFEKRDLPDSISESLRLLYMAGEFGREDDGRVEYYGERHRIPTTDEAMDLLDKAEDWAQAQAEFQREATGLEAMWLRAYEMVSKVSLILACPEGLRTAEHVRWATALVARDMHDKVRLVVSTMDKHKDPKRALKAKIANLCMDEGETESALKRKLRDCDKEMVAKAIEQMLNVGALVKVEPEPGKRGRPAVKLVTQARPARFRYDEPLP